MKKLNLLILDDNAAMRRVIARVLCMGGFADGRVFEAQEGEAALEILRREKIDLIFLDINMPGLNGLGFLQKKVADAALAPIAVVAITASGAEENRVLLKPYCMAFVQKPFTPEELNSAVAGLPIWS